MLWVGLDASAARNICVETLTIQTVLCGSSQERRKYKTVWCATAHITIYKRHDSDGGLDLMNRLVGGERPVFVLFLISSFIIALAWKLTNYSRCWIYFRGELIVDEGLEQMVTKDDDLQISKVL